MLEIMTGESQGHVGHRKCEVCIRYLCPFRMLVGSGDGEEQ